MQDYRNAPKMSVI